MKLRISYLILGLSLTAFGDPNAAAQCALDYVAGVDVSGHQPWTEWPKIREANHHFAYVKATEGLSVINPFLYRDFKELSTIGMFYGSYHYFIPSVDPVKQAQYYLAMSGAPRANELPPMLDLETNSGMPSSEVLRRAQIWLELVERLTGRRPIIYTYPRYWNNLKSKKNPKAIGYFARFPLFIADYRGGCPEVPAPWGQWTFWQRGIKIASGINGRVDDDVFNGTLAGLEGYIRESVSNQKDL